MKCGARQLLFLLSAAVLFMFAIGVPLPKGDTSNTESSGQYCQNSNPCGWAIYNQFSRQIEYYMKGSCLCTKDKECLRAEEDVTIAAYVYRCR